MQRFIRRVARPAPLVFALAASAALAPVSAQDAGVPAAEAQEFLGDWALPLDTGEGIVNLTLAIADEEGSVAAELTSDMGGPAETASRVRRAGPSLILNYSVDAQGQRLPVQITLTPSGDDLWASVDAADGMFLVEGTATRQ